jgi:hypothetical protein
VGNSLEVQIHAVEAGRDGERQLHRRAGALVASEMMRAWSPPATAASRACSAMILAAGCRNRSAGWRRALEHAAAARPRPRHRSGEPRLGVPGIERHAAAHLHVGRVSGAADASLPPVSDICRVRGD